ncbi:MAG: ferrous iron transport protein A [Phycisphaerales bacterium]|nr:ferrous iron transport protein A [Phycisphaerales bacterium]
MSHATTLDALTTGSEVVVLDTPVDDGPLLQAMGLEPGGRVRVARQGEPCIVEVNGSRIGLSSEICRQVQVEST